MAISDIEKFYFKPGLYKVQLQSSNNTIVLKFIEIDKLTSIYDLYRYFDLRYTIIDVTRADYITTHDISE